MTPEEQLTALRAALARGVRVVQRGSERIEYVSVAEMRGVIADLEAQLGLSSSAARQTYPRFVERPR